MKQAKSPWLSGLLAIAVMLSSPLAMAQYSGWYGGGNMGQGRANIDDDRINSNLFDQGFTSVTIEDEDRDFGYKLFGGYQFGKFISVEGGYFDIGKFGYTAEMIPAGTLDAAITVRGLNLDLVGYLPITEQFSAFARAGVNHAKVKGKFAGTGLATVTTPTTSERDTNYKFGFGLQYFLSERLGLRAEAERYRIDDSLGTKGDVDLFSVGLVYRFGATAAPVASRPEPVKEDVVHVIVPAPAQTQEYCSILDMQFEINQNTVQREYEEKIDQVGIFMTKYPETTAVIEGHSDEVGTSADNMRLSQTRAESVVSYLVDRHRINRSRLRAVGYGETRPIASNTTDVGRRLNRRINAVIACATDIEGLTPAPARVTMAMDIQFDTNQSNVRPQYRAELRKVADFMNANPAVTAVVEGHASNQQGTQVQSMQLSRRRAESVVNMLVNDFNVNRSRLTAEGFGETRRFAYNTSAEGQQQNRRVNIIFNFP
ncbi:MAG: OmpA family protein, partial [Gammaproteobacteria bacterium]